MNKEDSTRVIAICNIVDWSKKHSTFVHSNPLGYRPIHDKISKVLTIASVSFLLNASKIQAINKSTKSHFENEVQIIERNRSNYRASTVITLGFISGDKFPCIV